jgi:hypothetical protein
MTDPFDTVRDPVCLFHGRRWSEHEDGRCLYCCICFNSNLTHETCATDSEGQKWDVCDTEECRTMAGIA